MGAYFIDGRSRLKAEHANGEYASQRSQQIAKALRPISFDLPVGQITALSEPNGSGRAKHHLATLELSPRRRQLPSKMVDSVNVLAGTASSLIAGAFFPRRTASVLPVGYCQDAADDLSLLVPAEDASMGVPVLYAGREGVS